MATSEITSTRRVYLAEKYLTKKKYENALAEFKKMTPQELDPNGRAHSYLIYVEASLQLGRYEIINELANARDYFIETNNDSKYGRVKYCEGLYLAWKGKFIDSKEALYESYLIFKRLGDISRQILVLNRLAYVFYHTGDFQSAIEYLRRSLTLIKRSDRQKIAVAKLNIAQVYRISGDLHKSIDIYRAIRGTIAKAQNNNFVTYKIQSSIAFALMGDYCEAKINIDAIKLLLKNYIREQSIYYETLGWIYNLEGNYSAGLAELTRGLKIAEEIAPESALMSQIKRRMADSYLGLKEYNQAARFVGEALAVAEKLNERVEIAECLRIRAQLACHDGDHDTARENFKNAIDMFNMIGTRYNLAVCRFIAATSGLYRDGERNALLYLAREYFASEEVAHYVKKIDDEFNRRSFRVTPAPDAGNGDHPFIAVSPRTQKIVETAEMVAPSHISILLTGDTGTGKDLLAGYIHDCSGLTGKFVAINISAIPNEMIEAELFGHRKGAFTGADIDRVGLVEQAAEGTLFLNEIADATPAMQAKLLEVLERMAFRRLGENDERRVSFRLLTATNHNLEELVLANTFRADLYHRIRQVEITLPCLRDRTEDIPELVRHFCGLSGIAITGNGDAEAFDTLANSLARQDWPGNVRQLKSEIEKLAVLCNRSLVVMAEAVLSESVPEDERLRALLTRHNWNRSRVARELGVGESTVRSKIKRYGISHNSHLREK